MVQSRRWKSITCSIECCPQLLSNSQDPNQLCHCEHCFHCKSSQLSSGRHTLSFQGGLALLDSSPLPRLGEYFKNRYITRAYWYCRGRRGCDISSANRIRRYLPRCHVSSTSWGMASRCQGPPASHGSSNKSFRLKMLQIIYPVFLISLPILRYAVESSFDCNDWICLWYQLHYRLQ